MNPTVEFILSTIHANTPDTRQTGIQQSYPVSVYTCEIDGVRAEKSMLEMNCMNQQTNKQTPYFQFAHALSYLAAEIASNSELTFVSIIVLNRRAHNWTYLTEHT